MVAEILSHDRDRSLLNLSKIFHDFLLWKQLFLVLVVTLALFWNYERKLDIFIFTSYIRHPNLAFLKLMVFLCIVYQVQWHTNVKTTFDETNFFHEFTEIMMTFIKFLKYFIRILKNFMTLTEFSSTLPCRTHLQLSAPRKVERHYAINIRIIELKMKLLKTNQMFFHIFVQTKKYVLTSERQNNWLRYFFS